MKTAEKFLICLAAMVLAPVESVCADEAPAILIEQVILNCPAANLTPELRALEHTFHVAIERQCGGGDACRILANAFLDPVVVNAGCNELVVAPICGATENLPENPGAGSELTLPLRPNRDIVINCTAKPNPHF